MEWAMLRGRHEASRILNIQGGAEYLHPPMTRYFPDASSMTAQVRVTK